MYCWGSAENGELGIAGLNAEQIFIPKINNFGSAYNIKQVCSGLNHTIFLTESFQVYSSGSNEFGQLGHALQTRRPEHINALEGYTIIQIAAGDQHSLALTSWGEIYSWGENGFGQLGLNSPESHSDQPRKVKSLSAKHVTQICCGSNHTLVLTLDGELYAWGLNNNGQLGLLHSDSPIPEPCLIKTVNSIPISLIKAGGQHSTALTQTGFLLTWGSNKYGQLGRPTSAGTSCSQPKIVPNLATYSEPLRYLDVGENHTAVLDTYGKLWTFGYGKYGQLGHGNLENSSVPRPVLDLVGSKVGQVACGRCHTIVYIPSQGQLLAFGHGISGQLGIKSSQNRNVPQCVVGPWRSPNGKSSMNTTDITASNGDEEGSIFYVKNIFAGGDVSFVTISKNEKHGPDFCRINPYSIPFKLEIDKVNEMINVDTEDMVENDLFTYCEIVFSSLCCWNGSFFKAGASKLDHNLDFRLAEECLNKLGRVTKESLMDVVSSGIKKSFKDLPLQPVTPEAMRSYIILPLWKEFTDVKKVLFFHGPYVKAVLGLDTTSSIILKKWLHSLPLDFLRLLVYNFKKAIGYIISRKDQLISASPEDEKRLLLNCLKFLDMLYKENKSFPGIKIRLPYEEFYIPEIADFVSIRKDYINWLLARTSPYKASNQVCFCEYSFVFDSKVKTILLKLDASRQMQGAIQDAVLSANPLMCLFNPEEIQFLTLHIKRSSIVHDTIVQINNYNDNDLKRPLKIHFIGEEAEDAGGVKKEFFLLLLREILNPDFGMFTQFLETRTIWFSEAAFDVDNEMYMLIGVVCGLAIYNSTIINLPFPLALYKKLLDEPVAIDDLFELDPTVTKSLRILLDYEGDDVEDVFGLNFTATLDYFGENIIKPLKPGGQDIAVTSENKQEYVDAYVDRKLNGSIKKQYELFHKGFHKVCGGGIVKLFQPMELMALVIGNENYDWTEFENSTEYRGVYYKNHETIKWYWEVFDELSHELKKKFLLFLTGCDRIPILGMKTLKLTITPVGDEALLPVAHTCVLQLDLPIYKTKEKLKYKLTQAIQQTEGFGLI